MHMMGALALFDEDTIIYAPYLYNARRVRANQNAIKTGDKMKHCILKTGLTLFFCFILTFVFALATCGLGLRTSPTLVSVRPQME